jgi:polar amino acid transport system substrate-binding protein
MKFTVYALLTICAVAAINTASLSHASELPKGIKDAGKIRILVDTIYPPMAYVDPASGKLRGLDIELGDEIGKRLGVQVDWVTSSYAQLVPSLKTNRGDLIMSGMGDTTERQETFDFIDYIKIGGQFYTLSTNGSLNTRADLCGRSVGGGRASTIPGDVKAWSDENCVAQGKPAINVVGTETANDARMSVQLGRIDAAAIGAHTVRYNMGLFPDRFKLIGEPFNGKVAGVTFLKKDTALRDAVHAAMKEMVADGTYKRILEKWEMGDLAIIPLTVNNKQAQ